MSIQLKLSDIHRKDYVLGDGWQKEGHSGWVTSLSLLKDGTLASGSDDNTIKIWDTKSGECIKTLEGHTSSVASLSLLKDGTLASGSRDRTIKIWDTKSGECIKTLEGHASTVTSLSLLKDGTLASGSWDNTIKIWDTKSGKCIKTLEGHFNWVTSLSLLKDGTLASGSWDNTIKIWDTKSGKCIKTLEGHTSRVTSLSLLKDGTLASGSDDNTIKIWDTKSDECIKTLEGHTSTVTSLSLLKDGTLASGSRDRTIKIWDTKNGECIKTLDGHFNWVTSLSLLKDGTIASGSWDRTIKIWDTKSGECIKMLEGLMSTITSLSLLEDGTLASGSDDNTIKIWDTKSGECIKTLKGHVSSVTSLSLLKDGTLASGSWDNTIKIWNTKSGKCIKTLDGHSNWVASLSLLKDGTLASGSWDNTIRIWDTKSGECIKMLEGHTNNVISLSLLKDGTLASGSWDNTIRIWDTKSGECIKTIKISFRPIEMFCTDGLLYVALDDGGVVGFLPEAPYHEKGRLPFVETLDITGMVKLDENYLLLSFANGAVIKVKSSQGVSKAADTNIKETLNVKTLLIGDSGVGKTTFAEWLLSGGEFCEEIESTHAMQVYAKNLDSIKLQDKVEYEIELDIWDFGGQPEYQLSHQQNYAKSRLILLFLDLSRDRQDDDNHFWVNTIKEHLADMPNLDEIYIIGTKNGSDADSRLENATNFLKKHTGIKTCKYLKINTSDEKSDKFESVLKGFFEKQFKPIALEGYDNNIKKIIEELKDEASKKLFVKKSEYDGKDGFGKAINKLEQEGRAEIVGEYILLRPYWKNIIATAILKNAQENTTTPGALSVRKFFAFRGEDIRFSKTSVCNKAIINKTKQVGYDDELKNDQAVRQPKDDNELKLDFDKEFKNALLTNIAEKFLRDKICYIKDGMMVFPSRFSPTKHIYNHLDEFALAHAYKLGTKLNTEESIGKAVTSLYYLADTRIKKHLFDRVNFIYKGEEYWIVFERERCDKKNKAITDVKLYRKPNSTKHDELLCFLDAMIQKLLLPYFAVNKYDIKDDEDKQIGMVEVCVIHDDTIENSLESKFASELGEGLRAVKVRHEDSGARRALTDIEKKIINEIDGIKKFKTAESDDFCIVHLSDLHFSKEVDAKIQANLLVKDIKEIQKVERVDYLVLSGDISAKSAPEDFTVVREFLGIVIKELGLSANRVIVAAGNHDYSRKLSSSAYHVVSDKNFDASSDYKISSENDLYLKRDPAEWDMRFQYFSDELYNYLYNKDFNPRGTAIFEFENIAFAVINTSSKIDHFSTQKTTFDIDELVKNPSFLNGDKFKIVVGHHPFSTYDNIDFVAKLQNIGIDIYMHGHIHQDHSYLMLNHQNSAKQISIVGAGRFCGYGKEPLPVGIPFRYNVLKYDKAKKSLSINTRKREDTKGFWEAAYIYGNNNDKKDVFPIKQQPNK